MSPIWPLLISQSYFTTTFAMSARPSRETSSEMPAPAAASEYAPRCSKSRRVMVPRCWRVMVPLPLSSLAFVSDVAHRPAIQPGVDFPQIVVRVGEVAAARVPRIVRRWPFERDAAVGAGAIEQVHRFRRRHLARGTCLVNARPRPPARDAGMLGNVADLPQREGQPCALEVGEARRTATQLESQLADVERDRALDVSHQEAEVRDRIKLRELRCRRRHVPPDDRYVAGNVAASAEPGFRRLARVCLILRF